MNNKPLNPRFIALKICLSVVKQGRSLSQALGEGLVQFTNKRDRAFTQNLVIGTLRWQVRLEAIASHLLQKKLKDKDVDIKQLILLGLYQIIYLDTPEHAAVSATVSVTKSLKKPWAKALLNGVLRTFLREGEAICEEVDKKPAYKYSHPQWLTKKIRTAYPEHWQTILTANNQPAPLSIRNNPRVQSREDLKKQLLIFSEVAAIGFKLTEHPHSPQGLVFSQGVDITQLPSYDEGGFSVQDPAAQQAGYILNPQAGELILDACAAPGGKTTHILELSDNKAQVFALEKNPERIERLRENLYRLNLTAEIAVADASQPDNWWNGQLYDKILLDAPCSATGIIRRHPDIKWHRTPEDIAELVIVQANILKALWKLLKPAGQLLYSTCSILPEENILQVANFLANEATAQEVKLQVDWGSQDKQEQAQIGKQILPGEAGMDGFYYCLLSPKSCKCSHT